MKERYCTQEGHEIEYNILVGRNERQRPLSRAMNEWEDNIKIYLKIIVSTDVDWLICLKNGTSCKFLITR
jgi:hypothetical protein